MRDAQGFCITWENKAASWHRLLGKEGKIPNVKESLSLSDGVGAQVSVSQVFPIINCESNIILNNIVVTKILSYSTTYHVLGHGVM